MLLKVERVGQLLPAAVEELVEGALLRFFGGKRRGGGKKLAVQLPGGAASERCGVSGRCERCVVVE